MDRLLQFLFKTFVRRGNFQIITSRGTTFPFGDGTGRPATVRFTSRAAEWAVVLDPELKFGEIYMEGGLIVERGTIADVLAIILGQRMDYPNWTRPRWLLRFIKRRLQQFNPRSRSRRNRAAHGV